jgi:serine/threonine-protein kinase
MTAPDDGAADTPSDEVIGKTIAGKYKILRMIGRGGMGSVYEAEHLALGKHVAIKFVMREYADDETVSNRFAREARAASVVESPHIVTVFDVGNDDGRPYFVMELLRGEDLGSRLRREHRIPMALALHVIAQTLRGLSRAHEAGIVHRDLKPDNLFLCDSETDAEGVQVKIVDFGISKIKKAHAATMPLALTGHGTVLGTPFYMAPEQAQAKPDVDERADLYGVGAILFECLTGRPPHTGNSYEQVILAICMTDAPDLRTLAPNTPASVCAFVKRSLERDPIQRFKTARLMLSSLHEIAPEERKRVPLDSKEVLATQRSNGPDEQDSSRDVGLAATAKDPRSFPPNAPGTPARGVTQENENAPRLHPSERPGPPPMRSMRPLTVALAATGFGVILALAGLNVFAPKPPVVVLTVPGHTQPSGAQSVQPPASVSAAPSAPAPPPPSSRPVHDALPGSSGPRPLELQKKLP